MWTWYKEGVVEWAPSTMLLSRCRCRGVKPTRHPRPPTKYTDITTSSSPSTRIISLFNLIVVPSSTCTPQTWCAWHDWPRLPIAMPTMSNLALVVIGAVDDCAAISRNYVKLRTSTESWHQWEFIDVWAIGHAYCLWIMFKITMSTGISKKMQKNATALYILLRFIHRLIRYSWMGSSKHFRCQAWQGYMQPFWNLY